MNPAFERITGYTRLEVLGRRPSILKSGRQSLEFYEKMWDDLGRGRTFRGELVNKQKGGQLYHAELTVAPVFDGGRVTHFLAMHRDITGEIDHRVEAESGELKQDLIGIVSHDLRGPLSNVISHLDLLADELDGSRPRWAHLLDRARANARSMLDLIADLLDTSRIEAGKLRLVLTAQDMGEMVQDALDQTAFLAAAKSISLHAELDPEPLPVTVDRGKIQQVLSNLISNAIKFSPPGTTVRAGARRSARSVEVWVHDQGPGIAAADLPRVFEKFSCGSTRPTGGEGGTGLGLYIVDRLLRLHHGRISVHGSRSDGARFVFTLPADMPAEQRCDPPRRTADGTREG